MTSKLRLGLLLDSLSLPAWAFTAIKRIVNSTCAELVLVVLNQSRPSSRFAKQAIWQDPQHWFYRIFNAIEERLFIRSPNALAQIDASEVLAGVAVIGVKPLDEIRGQFFSEPDVKEIRSYQLDVLIKFGFEKLQGDILAVATHGVWAYRWGDSRKINDGLTGFWEVVEGWPETGVALQQLKADPGQNLTLFESWLFTYPYSPARNRNYVLWTAASFLPRQVERLHRLGSERYSQELNNHRDVDPHVLRPNDIPSNLVVLETMLKLVYRSLCELYRRRFSPERWELLVSMEPGAEKNLSAFKKISPPKDRFWADPHVVYEEPTYYIFIEEYLHQTRKGHISVMAMDQAGNYSQPLPVLKEDHHLSFPFVFSWMGHYYMIPESSENSTIDLYECIEFPHRWQHKITLMEHVKAVDTTAFYVQGKWWLFTAIAEQEAAAPQFELFLFFSNELFTNRWKAHPMNPVISDVKKARNAGRVFQKDGKLMRPSQDCSITYGYGFDLNEIVTLSETEYSERTVTSVRPDLTQSFIAAHTFATIGNLTVVDALPPR